MRWDLIILLVATIGVFFGAVSLVNGIFGGDVNYAANGAILLILAGVVGFVFIRTPILEYLDAALKGHNTILVLFRPGRRVSHVSPDRVDDVMIEFNNKLYWKIPGTAYHEKGYVVYPVVELTAPTFPPNAPPALREITEKYGIQSPIELKRLVALANDPNVPEDERKKIQDVLADIDRIMLVWGQSFGGDSVASWIANLSPQALKAAVDHKVAAATASMRLDISWKMVIALAIVLMMFLAGLWLLTAHGDAGGVQVAQTAVDTAKTVVDANATTLVG